MTTTRQSKAKAKADAAAEADLAPEPVEAPPFWVAKVPLPVGAEMGSGGPRAFSPGDQVPAEHVERFGWQEFVEPPEGDWPPAVLVQEPDEANTAKDKAEAEDAKTNDDAGKSGSDEE